MTNGHVDNAPIVVAPSVDIIETKASYVVTLDIPGAEKNSIKAQIDNNTLTVTAAVTKYFSEENEPVREYKREFSLANDVDLSTIDAKYELGVLTVTLNKKPQFLSKEIAIN